MSCGGLSEQPVGYGYSRLSVAMLDASQKQPGGCRYAASRTSVIAVHGSEDDRRGLSWHSPNTRTSGSMQAVSVGRIESRKFTDHGLAVESGDQMMRFRVGVSLNSFQLPLKRALVAASTLQADGVEIDARGELSPAQLSDSGIRQLRKRLSDLRLSVSAVHFPTRRGYQVSDALEPRIAATKRAMDFAFALGCNVVTNHVGHIAEDGDPSWSTLIEALTDIGRHGQHCGAFLATTTGSEDAAAMKRLLDALPEGSLMVDFDPGSLIINGFSANESLQVLGQHVVHVRARDGVRDLARGRGLEVAVGRGSVDFPQLLATIEQFGFRGYLTVDRSHSSEPLQEISDAISFLREIQK